MRFASFSFGCRVNEAEKLAIDQALLKKGLVYDEKNPEIFIINSCAVTHKAERETRQFIYQLKRKFPNIKIILTGCAATFWKKYHLFKNLPVDLLADNNQKTHLVEMILKKYLPKKPKETKEVFTSKFLTSGRFLIKIQDGCHRFCSYCIVPYLRGKPRSQKISSLIKKIKEKENLIKELILTAINTEDFGKDTKENFVDLIDQILKKTTIPRISFGSINPWSIDEKFLNFYQKVISQNRIVNFFHIPLQSGSNKILKLMNRGYTKEEILEKIHQIKKINQFAFLATDIIVGFPGETEKDFEETYQFLENSPFSRFHVFRFSLRKGTTAELLKEKYFLVSEKIKTERAKILRELSLKKFSQFCQENIGRVAFGLVLDKKKNGYYHLLLDNQLPAIIKKEKIVPATIIKVKITQFHQNSLLAVSC